MFLRNWYNILKAVCYGGSSTADVGITVKNLDGVSFDINNYSYSSSSSSTVLCAFPQSSRSNGIIMPYFGEYKYSAAVSADVFYKPTICFGSGVTPPTLDDYCLENRHTTNLECVTNGIKRVIIDNTVSLELSYTLRNIGNTDALIAEIGIVTSVTYGDHHQQSHPCLIDRTVLTEPVTITPGNMDVITYTITYNLPSPD